MSIFMQSLNEGIKNIFIENFILYEKTGYEFFKITFKKPLKLACY